jgi:hypothetical protein
VHCDHINPRWERGGRAGPLAAETCVLGEGLLPAPLDVPNDALSNGNLYPYFENSEQLFDCLDEQHFAGFTKPCNSGSPASKTAIRYACSKQASAFYVDFGLPNRHTYKLAFMVGGTEPSHHTLL